MAVEMQSFGVALFRYIIEILPAQVHISGGIRDDQKIPVIERIGRIFRSGDPRIDIHDLCKSAQIIPVIVGQPGSHLAAGHRPGSRIGIPGDAPSGQENTQIANPACLNINMVAGTVSRHAFGQFLFIPDLFGQDCCCPFFRLGQERGFQADDLNSLGDGLLHKITQLDSCLQIRPQMFFFIFSQMLIQSETSIVLFVSEPVTYIIISFASKIYLYQITSSSCCIRSNAAAAY